MITAGPDPLAPEFGRLARESRPLLPGPVPASPPPPDPRDFHAALWAWLVVATSATVVLGLALGAAIRWALGLPILGGP